MKISTIIFTLILIYNSVLSFLLFNPGWCSDSKTNKMYSTFTNAYLFNLIINTIILISIATNSYTPSTLLGGILLASYGWLFAASYTLYKDENTPDCLKRIAMATMVFASLFMILIPVAVYSFKKDIDINIIKSICGVETGKECDVKMAKWYQEKVVDKINNYTVKLKEKAEMKKKAVIDDKKTSCEANISAANTIIDRQKELVKQLSVSITSHEEKLKNINLPQTTIDSHNVLKNSDNKKKQNIEKYINSLEELRDKCEEEGNLKKLGKKINEQP